MHYKTIKFNIKIPLNIHNFHFCGIYWHFSRIRPPHPPIKKILATRLIYSRGKWYIGLNPWLWIKGLRVRCPALLSFSETPISTLLLSTEVYKRVPGRMRALFVAYNVACARPRSGAWPECYPGSWEGALWVQDWCWIQWSGVIIHCTL